MTCDILAVAVDHLKDQEVAISARGAAVMKRFAPLFHLARIFLGLNVLLLVVAFWRSPPKMTLIAVAFAAPAFLWATPLHFSRIGTVVNRFVLANDEEGEVEYDSPKAPFIIKRVPGMKAIFDGIIRGYVLSHPVGLCFFDSKTAVEYSSSSTQHCSYHGNQPIMHLHG